RPRRCGDARRDHPRGAGRSLVRGAIFRAPRAQLSGERSGVGAARARSAGAEIMTPAPSATRPGVLVSDFDGTMTRHDFYKRAIESLLPPDTPDYWAEYRAGTITHFEALRRYFASIRASEAELLAVVARMELDPELPAAVASLRRAGWEVVVTSAGCDWYI